MTVFNAGMQGLGRLFGRRESTREEYLDASIAFVKRHPAQDYTDEEHVRVSANKRQCTCEKDPNFKFGCKHAVQWFAHAVLQAKLKKKLKQSGMEELLKSKKKMNPDREANVSALMR